MNERRLDFWLLMATILVLFILSALCIGSMFYFKGLGIHGLPQNERLKFIDLMNTLAAPMVAILILILILCVPKRIIRGRAIGWAWGIVALILTCGWVAYGIKKALLILVALSVPLQFVVLIYAISRPSLLHIQKSGYWIRVGSPLIHLALLLFILDLYLYRDPMVHLALFWLTTLSAGLGMIFCFWADSVSYHAKRLVTWITSRKIPL